jgi:hypothetical protein
MINQKGGVVKKNPGKPAQDILHDTLESGGVVLNVISDGSLKCFVIEIIINDPRACEYIDTNASGSFRNPVERLVMKILITDDRPDATFTNEYIGIDGVARYKEPETPVNIIEEAKVQQEAWIKTVVNGRVPVCPSVADLIFFDNQNGKNFITYLQTKFAPGNPLMDNICRYILDRLQLPYRGICVMVMPEVSAPAQVLAAAQAGPQAGPSQASITLYGFLNLPDGSNFQGLIVDQAQKNRAYCLIIACVLRLYWVGIVHLDLHAKNFLLYVDQNGILQGKIIDLGNSIIFTNGTNKFIVDQADIDTLRAGLETYKNGIIENIGNDTFIRKRDFVVGLLDIIKQFDTKGNHQVFPGTLRFDITRPEGQDDNTNCQMGWWQTVKDKEAADTAGTDHSFSDIIYNAYNFARDGFMVDIDARNPGVATSTIQRYIGQGRIPSFSDITPVMVGWPWVVAIQGQGATAQGPGSGNPGGIGNNGMVIGPGGGGTRKQTRRKNKFRKNKTKRLALRKTKNKKRRRTSKK